MISFAIVYVLDICDRDAYTHTYSRLELFPHLESACCGAILGTIPIVSPSWRREVVLASLMPDHNRYFSSQEFPLRILYGIRIGKGML